MRRICGLSLTLLLGSTGLPAQSHPWLSGTAEKTLAERVSPPPGYTRLPASPNSFAAWLRGLPLHPGRPEVRLFDGRKKSNQRAQYAVFDIDVGTRDLQQCADAVIRLRAEYLLARGCEAAIAFDFTSGDTASWTAWQQGQRPQVSGNRVRWTATARPDDSYANFRRYLDTVFTYAGSYSLSKELVAVADPSQLEPGDVFIQGGFPGHAVIVVDVAANAAGERVFLLAQSFMPAQDIHLLVDPTAPAASENPWYPARPSGILRTPEWRFDYGDLRRFPVPECSL